MSAYTGSHRMGWREQLADTWSPMLDGLTLRWRRLTGPYRRAAAKRRLDAKRREHARREWFA